MQRRLLTLRGNDLLAQSSTETLLEMLKAHSGIKDCSEETVLHINGVCTLHCFKKHRYCVVAAKMGSSFESIDYCSSLSVHCFLRF